MNNDYKERALINTNTLIWQKTKYENVFKKILAIKTMKKQL